MSPSIKANVLQAYQVILYGRALHPELFRLQGRRVHRRGEYEFEAWGMAGMHVLRFGHRGACACELLTDQEKSPTSGLVSAFLCAGERDFEHRFERERITYMTSIQTETLSDSLFASTFEEIAELARTNGALTHRWEDEAGRSLSVIDIQEFNREVHAHCYHLLAAGNLVIRTQSLFEHLRAGL